MIIDRINFKQPKYVLPAILYPLLLIAGYLVFDIFDTEVVEKTNDLQTTEFLNPELPQAQVRNDGISGKYESMVNTYGSIQDYSAVENIERDGNEKDKEEYDSKYSEEDIALLDAEAKEMLRLHQMQERLQQSAEKGNDLMNDSAGVALPDKATRMALADQRQKEALAELNKALAEARLRGEKTVTDQEALTRSDNMETTGTTTVASVTGTVSVNEQAVSELSDDDEAGQVVKKVRTNSDYFNTISENDPEPKLIKAIIDENIKAVDGSRVRLRLLDDVEINDVIVPRGSYIYAIMSGFGSQRVKGNVKSILVADELVKVSLSLYDTDGLEGLYVPGSSFRETAQDVASGALNNNMTLNNGAGGTSVAQWGMQAVQNAYQRTSNAISKAIRKNKAKLKYGTQVYLVNSREKKNN